MTKLLENFQLHDTIINNKKCLNLCQKATPMIPYEKKVPERELFVIMVDVSEKEKSLLHPGIEIKDKLYFF